MCQAIQPEDGTVMEGSKLGFQTWVPAIFLMATNLKFVSSMKLHHDFSINRRSAWFNAVRFDSLMVG